MRYHGYDNQSGGDQCLPGIEPAGKYEPDHILMIGDAPGDMRAGHDNHALFYPINPGHEEESWQRFFEEAVYRFLNGEYEGEYEAQLVAEFQKFMPETPPWKR